MKKNTGLDWWYHPHIIQISSISPKYRPNIPRSIFFTTPQLNEKIWHGYFKKKLHFEIRLKLFFLSSRNYPNIIQISFKYHPEIIQKSSRNHPEITQKSSSRHRFLQPPNFVKSRVLTQILARLLLVKTPLLNSIKTPLLEGKSRISVILLKIRLYLSSL